MSGAFSGRVALVTGGASGIGAATAADRDLASAQAHARAIGAEPVALDVTSPEAWEAAMARVGAVDILVNAAGISRDASAADVAGVSLATWRAVFAVNVEGALLGCQHAMRAMGSRGGAIVNMRRRPRARPQPRLPPMGRRRRWCCS